MIHIKLLRIQLDFTLYLNSYIIAEIAVNRKKSTTHKLWLISNSTCPKAYNTLQMLRSYLEVSYLKEVCFCGAPYSPLLNSLDFGVEAA